MQQFSGQGQQGAGGGATGASLLHNALYGARSGSSGLSAGTALYRNFNAAPRDKGILAAAVDDAFMSPESDPVSIAAAVDPMAIDTARYNAAAAALIGDKGGVAAEAVADLSRGGRAADGSHRLNLGVVNLAAAAAAPDQSAVGMTAAQQQPATKAALYGAYQQARAPLAAANGHATSLYANNRNVPAATAAAAAAPPAAAGRYTAAQYHQLNVVRQVQLRQQAAAAAAAAQKQQQQQAQAQAAAAQLKAEQQAHVLAAAAEVAQQVAARNAAAEQQRQARAAAEQRLLAGTAGSNATACDASATAHSTVYKRTSTETASVLYKRPALGAGAAGAVTPGAAAETVQRPVSTLYGAYVADRHAASSAAPAVANELIQRLQGHSAATAAAVAVPAARAAAAEAITAVAQQSTASAQSTHMTVSPAPENTPGDSHCSETAFLDCHEDLSDDAAGADGIASYGIASALGASGDSSASVSLLPGGAVAAAFGGKAIPVAPKTLARPIRPYGPVYCPTVYADVSSPHALALANNIMSRIRLPGGIRFMPVSTDSMLYYNGVHWGFSAFALTLGSSYFQRLVEITPTLNAAVRHAPPFAAYAAYMNDGGGAAASAANKQPQQQQEYLHKDGLRSILFTCAYLATKVVDRMPHTDMLRRMLSMLYNVPVSREEAHSVELKCLEGLGYRLGPYFLHNVLEDEPPCCDLY